MSNDPLLWEILFILDCVIDGLPCPKEHQGNKQILHVVFPSIESRIQEMVALKAILGQGDSGEHVITIQLPEEV